MNSGSLKITEIALVFIEKILGFCLNFFFENLPQKWKTTALPSDRWHQPALHTDPVRPSDEHELYNTEKEMELLMERSFRFRLPCE